MRMSRSTRAWRVLAPESFSLPRADLIAISESETALISRILSVFSKAAVARLVRRSGDSTAQMRMAVSRSRRTSITPFDEGIHLVIRHGLPPVRLEDLNSALQTSQLPLLAG